MSATTFQVIAKPHPFQKALAPMSFDAGASILDIVGARASRSLRVDLDGHEVPRHAWGAVKPKPGHVLHATVYPQGGDDNKAIRIVGMIAIAVLSYYTGGLAAGAYGGWGTSAGALAGYAASAAVSMIGMMALTPMIGGAREIAE